MTTYVREHFERPIIKRYDQSEGAPPERLVYLLDHDYTQHSLSWNSLKNGDRVRIAALRAAAERLDCECFLALAEVHEIWSAYEEDDWDNHYRYNEDEDDDSEDEDCVESEKYDLNELIDNDITLHHWIDSAGQPMDGVPGFVNDYELHFTKPSSDMHPFKSEYEGYQGNYGNTLDRWYHRAAFVMWPRANTFALRAQASPQWAVNELLALPRENTVEFESRVKTLLRHWKETANSVEDSAFFAKLLEVSTRLSDSTLAIGWLVPLGLERLGREAMTRDFVPLIDKHGLSWAKELLAMWTQNRSWGLAPWVPLLAEICGDLHVSNRAPSHELAIWFLEMEVNIVRERFVVAFQRLPPWLDFDGFAEESNHLAHVLAAAVGISAFQVIDETLGFLINAKKNLPTSFFVSVLRACIARSPALGAHVVGSALHRECTSRLEAILRAPARKEGDWTMMYPLGCPCNDCNALKEFLGSSHTELDWPLNKERRQHIHRAIDSAQLPVRHTTSRTGRPYVLQLRKDPSLFSRERAYRAHVKQILEALPTMPPQ